MLGGSPGPVALRRRGAVAEVIVAGTGGAARAPALIDTGSTVSAVDLELLRQVGAPQIGSRGVGTVGGVIVMPVHAVRLLTPSGVVLADTALGDDPRDGGTAGVRVLLGRDVLARFRLVYDGPGGAWGLDQPAPPAGLSPALLFTAGLASSLAAGLILQALARRAR